MVDYKKQGKQNRKKGAAFELKVRKKLEHDGWIVTKWQNQIDLDKGCIVPAKQKFIGGRGMGLGSGFPDFVCFHERDTVKGIVRGYNVMFVEAKSNNILKKEEKLKLEWLRKNGHICWVAYDGGAREPYFRKFVEYRERPKICPKEIRHSVR